MFRLLLLVIALIVYGSLYPWHFDFTRDGGNPLSTLLHSHPSELNKFALRDAAVNLLLYLPLGWAAALVMLRRVSAASALAVTIVFAAILSASMEMLQIYIASRYCSLFDVTANVIGAGAGAVLALIFRRRKWPLPVRFNAAAMFLLACWVSYQLFPFFPLFSRTRVLIKLQMLIHSIPFSTVDMWASAAEWFTVGVVMEALAVRMRSRWLLAAMCCLPLRLLVVERTVTIGETVGAALALLLWLAIREKSRARSGRLDAGFGHRIARTCAVLFRGRAHGFFVDTVRLDLRCRSAHSSSHPLTQGLRVWRRSVAPARPFLLGSGLPGGWRPISFRTGATVSARPNS